MSKLTLVHQGEVLHLYRHEDHGYSLADWQPVFRAHLEWLEKRASE